MKQTSGAGAMDERSLRKLSADWPGVTAEIKWDDDLIFMVAGKMFCGLCVKGADKGKLAFKVEEERFLEFTDRPGIVPAPYMARSHWISMDDASVLPRAELQALVRRAYELVRGKLPKKLQRELADG
ncbi:MmcQ/YjbR family DNA-binding protein [Arenimonas terrae]|jgi:predicted DNA-binding protein (MmcQ/YjbR family)|nr:MmcQ/YjbR family DNA-binding protein [Arenimonas terrae]